jgi:hypothetical protein
MVAEYGMQQEKMGRQLSMIEAVNETVERFNLNSYTPAPVDPVTTEPIHNNVKEFPSIVNKGSSESPVAQNVKTFDDLVKLSNSI